MPSTPNFDFPYPAATDPVTEGASAIQALAEALDRKGVLASAQRVTDLNVTATAPPGDLVLTAPTVTVSAGMTLFIEVFAPSARLDLSGIVLLDSMLFQDGVNLGIIARIMHSAPAALDQRFPLYGAARFAPPAGDHVYEWRAHVNAGAGNTIYAGDVMLPAFIRVSAE